jgi:hypothetical protein
MDQVISLVFFLVVNGGALWAVPGFLAGRWHAETFAAKFDMERRWNGRKNYREG